jgi:hypothetical protein
MNDKKDDNEKGKKRTQKDVERIYSMLELDGSPPKEAEGFVTVILYIEGDIKDARMICLN